MTSIDRTQHPMSDLRCPSVPEASAPTCTHIGPASGLLAGMAASAAAVAAQRIGSIEPTDPHRRQKAARIYLEAELIREFGSDLLNDPAFPQMLDAIQQQMQADAQTAAAVNALGDLLLAGKAP
jgi:hypothetical protein